MDGEDDELFGGNVAEELKKWIPMLLFHIPLFIYSFIVCIFVLLVMLLCIFYLFLFFSPSFLPTNIIYYVYSTCCYIGIIGPVSLSFTCIYSY